MQFKIIREYRQRHWWQVDGPLWAPYLRLRPPAPLTDCLRQAWWLERLIWRVRGLFTPRREVHFDTASHPMTGNGDLLKYHMPITKIIENNSVKDIQEIDERVFSKAFQAALKAGEHAPIQVFNVGNPRKLKKTPRRSRRKRCR